jgi:D-alanyl-D-alanine carboxypeptidase
MKGSSLPHSELEEALLAWTSEHPRASILVACLDEMDAAPVLAFEQDTALPPGSTVKVVLAAGALLLMPPGFRDPILAALADAKLLAALGRSQRQALRRRRHSQQRDGFRPRARSVRRHAASEFHRRIVSLSLRIGGPERFGRGFGGHLRGPLSPQLPALLRRMNVGSDNLVALCLAADVGAVAAGTADAGVGIARIETVLKERGLLREGDRIVEPSGLSADNRLSAASLVRVLVDADANHWGAGLRRSLPRPGEGTLRGRFGADNGSVPSLRAKTGHLPGLAALAGYVASEAGKRYAFAFLMCDTDVQGAERAQDRIVGLLAAGAADPEHAARKR